MIYVGIEVLYPYGRENGRVGWRFVYEHNGREWRSIDSYSSREEAKAAGRAFCS